MPGTEPGGEDEAPAPTGAHSASSLLARAPSSGCGRVGMEPWWWLGNGGCEPLPRSQLLAFGSSLAANPPGARRWQVRVENPRSPIKEPILFLRALGKPSGGPRSCPVCSRDATLLRCGDACPKLVRQGQRGLWGHEHPSCARSPPSSLSMSTCLGLSSWTENAFCCL